MAQLLDLVRTAAPADLPITVAEARAQLRLGDDDSQDQLLAQLIAAAVDHLDGYAGTLGRAIVTQSWRLGLEAFPTGAIDLPLPPLQSIDSIAYVDGAGATQTLAESDYTVIDGPLSRVVPAFATQWPSARKAPRAVTLTFTAGWAVADVPRAIRQALLIITEGLFEGGELTELVQGRAVKALLNPWRCARF